MRASVTWMDGGDELLGRDGKETSVTPWQPSRPLGPRRPPHAGRQPFEPSQLTLDAIAAAAVTATSLHMTDEFR